MTTAATTTASRPPLPPVLGRLLQGSFWLALRSPLQILFALWSVPLILSALSEARNGAYYFAMSFGFIQFLLEFGMSSALQRQVSDRWTHGDKVGVDRAVACGTTFYAAVAVIQAASLLAIAYFVLPHSKYEPGSPPYRLIVKLLWLQAATAPCFGLAVVVSSVLQAARRYDFVPRLEVAIIIFRFAVLVTGLALNVDFFLIVATQYITQAALSLGPAMWVMVRELGYVPHFRGARWEDYRGLFQVSLFVFVIQLSIVLSDKLDKTVLGFALAEPGPATTIYENVSKGFVQIRQTGWMLSYLVMPAVASLAAARDDAGLERIKYDGSRFLIGLLMPMALLAGLYARPFLTWWVGARYAPCAPLMQLFLVATIPLVISVLVQAAIGLGKIKVIALAALVGSLINLPLSYWLTTRIGVAGVIWGTVLTTLVSNLLVPGVYVFRVLEVNPATFFTRTLGAPLIGAAILLSASWLLSMVFAPDPVGRTRLARTLPLAAHILFGILAYVSGYVLLRTGRMDLATLGRKLLRRSLPA